jgi:proliferating cell nuclear antigen PCNA
MSATPTSEATQANYLFRARTKEAFVIKILSELLSNASIKFAPIRIDADGIHLCQADANNHQLINFTLHRENFFGFKTTKPLNFLVNSSHFYKMLKSIKKKDTITLFIKDDDSCKLGICVETSDENNKTNTHIRITYNQPQVFDEPTGYNNPTIISNKEFQKMKNLHNISKQMQVTCPYSGLIKFFCDGQEVYEREVVLGNEYQNDDVCKDDEPQEEYKQTFNTTHITGLTKCANQSGNVQIFVHRDLPLKIKMKAGNLGHLTVFIKSKERMLLEQKLEAEKKLEDGAE